MADEKRPIPFHDDIAIDTEGKVFDIGLTVRQQCQRILAEGKLIAVIAEVDGDVSMQVMGPPDPRVIEILEQALKGLKQAIAAASKGPVS